MTNSNKLKGRIISEGYTLETFAKELDLSKSTLSLKINNKVKFLPDDIKKSSEILHLTADEIKEIFLC